MNDLSISGSWSYDRYWTASAEATEARQAELSRLIALGRVTLPPWARPYVMQHKAEEDRALDWLSHLAHLPTDEYDLAWHVCETALEELVHGLSLMVYDALIPGWALQPFRYAPDDDLREGYVGILDDGIERIQFCPWCGVRLPALVDDGEDADVPNLYHPQRLAIEQDIRAGVALPVVAKTYGIKHYIVLAPHQRRHMLEMHATPRPMLSRNDEWRADVPQQGASPRMVIAGESDEPAANDEMGLDEGYVSSHPRTVIAEPHGKPSANDESWTDATEETSDPRMVIAEPHGKPSANDELWVDIYSNAPDARIIIADQQTGSLDSGLAQVDEVREPSTPRTIIAESDVTCDCYWCRMSGYQRLLQAWAIATRPEKERFYVETRTWDPPF